jgi:hypothetical protein
MRRESNIVIANSILLTRVERPGRPERPRFISPSDFC